MSWGWVVILDTELDTEISELGIVELFPIIRHQGSRDFEPENYGTLNKVTFLLLGDSS